MPDGSAGAARQRLLHLPFLRQGVSAAKIIAAL